MSHEYQKILVAYDGSSDSMKAIRQAESLAKAHHASLIVVYVHDQNTKTKATMNSEPVFSHGASMMHNTTNYVPYVQFGDFNPTANKESIGSEAQKLLGEVATKISDDIKEVHYETLVGDPAKTLVQYAEDQDMDLIVLGNRGISGLRQLVMGSVSNKVANESNIPVLIAK
ncbi:universal stress protein [Alkalibacillus salilacus]|uniref:Nucleotide-binding universal stress UspA family protein n=1 Tax=Alkalibacillus salilacus TaxID=284582 RepID=A0ABT9VGA2_9BACI|nr:universal stress protein [Alkalibacillus salilacus]MDQ0160002.1 nucleotide-binding universal stress UspA family protein [Alkalibacillus salilacus]